MTLKKVKFNGGVILNPPPNVVVLARFSVVD